MEMALTFNDFTFTPVTRQNSLWIRAAELARALGYKQENSVSRLYRSNADEFTPDMTQLIEIPAESRNGFLENLSEGRIRIFSLRGCHLLAMFARTPVAKAFRRWVLDVLDRLNAERQSFKNSEQVTSPISKRSDPERKALTAIINTWVGMAPIHYANARAQVNAHFGVTGVDAMTVAQVKEAIQWVQGKIDALPPAEEQPALPSAPTGPAFPFRAEFPADMGSDRKEAMQRMERIARDMHTSFSIVRNIVRLGCHPGGYSMNRSPSEREAYRILENFYVAADESLAAAYNALEAGYRFGRLYGRG
ncbi:MAG: hypothetical protein K2O70_06700 [Desulfovibrionaceae bacterium]|nr:hypothetical protein [Desulfovibrionaceae bacterium]